MPGPFIVVLTTFGSPSKARQISKTLLQKKIAACVNILGPAQSFFWWEGKVDKAREHLVLIKTKASYFARLQKFLEKNHPYSVPEIIALPVIKGNASYLNWITKSLK